MVRGSARPPCLCSSFYSLRIPIELKLVIPYRSSDAQVVYIQYSVKLISITFLVVTIDCYQCLMILIVGMCMGFNMILKSGRWTKPTRTPLEERLCYLCNTLEDECHFVLECPAYNEFRCKYIHKYYWKRPSMSKFTELMTTDNKPILQKLACFVQKSYALRNELLYTQA